MFCGNPEKSSPSSRKSRLSSLSKGMSSLQFSGFQQIMCSLCLSGFERIIGYFVSPHLTHNLTFDVVPVIQSLLLLFGVNFK